jgi:plasmid replication initiation protein
MQIKPIPQTKAKVYKSKPLNQAGIGNLNLSEYQIFLQLISQIRNVDAIGNPLPVDQLQRTYKLTAKDYAKQFNVDIKNAYVLLKKSADKLMNTNITIPPDLFNVEVKINICSMAKYHNNEGYIEIKFTDDIMPHLVKVKSQYLLYNLKEIANFGSLYTTRLYELIQEFKTTGYFIKSIAELRKLFETGTKYKEYKNFKAKCLTHAINEINSQYPTINLVMSEIRESRAVTSIELIFNKTYIIQAINPITQQPKNIQTKPKQIPVIKPKPIEKEQPEIAEPEIAEPVKKKSKKPKEKTKDKIKINDLIEKLKSKNKKK